MFASNAVWLVGQITILLILGADYPHSGPLDASEIDGQMESSRLALPPRTLVLPVLQMHHTCEGEGILHTRKKNWVCYFSIAETRCRYKERTWKTHSFHGG